MSTLSVSVSRKLRSPFDEIQRKMRPFCRIERGNDHEEWTFETRHHAIDCTLGGDGNERPFSCYYLLF